MAWNNSSNAHDIAVFGGAPGNGMVQIAAPGISTGGLQFDNTGYNLMGAPLTLSAPVGSIPTIDTGENTATITSSMDGTAFKKVGTGTLILAGVNTLIGATIVAGGTLKVDNNGTSTLGKITGSNAANSIAVNTGGTLLLAGAGSADRVGNSAGITLGGGTLAIALGSSEGTAATVTGGTVSGTSALGLGTLTLSASSTLDFDSLGIGTLMVFASFVPGAFTLNITGYSNANVDGVQNSGLATDDRLVFMQDLQAAGLLSSINFGAGLTATQMQLDSGFYEIAPIPEPSALCAALALVGLVGWREHRNRQLARQAQRRASC